jgi:outer membrane protein TolC
MLEVKVAVREVSTAYEEASATYQSMVAAQRRLEYIEARWKHLGEDRSIGLYLEDLLNTQERLAETEFGFLKARTTYSLSLMNLKRAMGTLLQDERIVQGNARDQCLPLTVLEKELVTSHTPFIDEQPQMIDGDLPRN